MGALSCTLRGLAMRPGKGRQHLSTAHQQVVLIGACLHCMQATAVLFHWVCSCCAALLLAVGWQLARKECLLTRLEVKRLKASYNTNQASTLFVSHYRVKNKLSMHTKHGLTMTLCECLKDWERRRKQTPVSHSVCNKLYVLSQTMSYPKDNVSHTGEGKGVFCHMVKTNYEGHLCVLW